MKALIFFPWGIDCILKKNNGAGLRVSLLTDFLTSHGMNVECVSLGWKEKTVTNGNAVFSNKRLFSAFGYLLYGACVKLSTTTGWVFPMVLAQFVLPRNSQQFQRICRDLSGDADLVFIEYPFWVNPLEKVIRPETPIILTDHDQIWRSWSGSGPFKKHFEKILLKLELDAMRLATSVVFTSKEDAGVFASFGVTSSVIPNSIDFRTEESVRCDDSTDYCESSSLKAALFVGGGWYPNIEAAKVIITQIAPTMTDFKFIIVGRCCESLDCIPKNVILKGEVSPEKLDSLYADVEFVLVPVVSGTGSSLKTIEALSRGKFVISTSVGARGLDAVSLQHLIIEDDFTRYNSWLEKFADDVEGRKFIRSNAMKFASNLDYRKSYLPYLQMIDEYQQSMSNPLRTEKKIMTTEELQVIRDKISKANWFHSFEILPGIFTPGQIPCNGKAYIDSLDIPAALEGKSAIDIGTWDGYIAFELAKRGALTTALDIQDPSRTGFNIAREILELDVEYIHTPQGVYDLPNAVNNRTFDIIMFLGVFYHLKNPIKAFECVASIMHEGSFLYFEGESFHVYAEDSRGNPVKESWIKKAAASDIPLTLCYPGRYKGASNWFIPNMACLRSWLESAGLEVLKISPMVDSASRPAGQRTVGIARKVKSAPVIEHELR